MFDAEEQAMKVGVVGLGYVGLTLATVLAEVGCRVYGIEKRPDVVRSTNDGEPHFSEAGLREALVRVVKSGHLTASEEFGTDYSCDAYIITVGTPLDEKGNARLDMIEVASRQVAAHMKDGAMVILRSTVKVGTARNVVSPILAATGKRFDIAMCPERTLEGRALQELRELPQIVGANDQVSRDRAAGVFRQLTNSIVQVSSLESAEMVKLVDNTYRDVHFAFANEVARACEAVGINAHEVIVAGKLGYTRTNVPMPGLVGGPCLEKDPHILLQSVLDRGVDLEITRAARLVNERQPAETVAFILREMERRGAGPAEKVALLGLAFKGVPATDDVRGSMALKVLSAIRQARPALLLHVYDPVIATSELTRLVPGSVACETLDDAVRGAMVVIIANNHPDLGRVPPLVVRETMKKGGFIYDYWNNFSNLSRSETGDFYFAVGNNSVNS